MVDFCRDDRSEILGFIKSTDDILVDEFDWIDTRNYVCPCGNEDPSKVKPNDDQTSWICEICGKSILVGFDESEENYGRGYTNSSRNINAAIRAGDELLLLSYDQNIKEESITSSFSSFCSCHHRDNSQIVDEEIGNAIFVKCKLCGKKIGQEPPKPTACTPFCSCGNNDFKEFEEYRTRDEIFWRCKICGKGIGEQDKTLSSTPNKNHQSQNGSNNCLKKDSVRKESKYCLCGNKGETFQDYDYIWKCRKCSGNKVPQINLCGFMDEKELQSQPNSLNKDTSKMNAVDSTTKSETAFCPCGNKNVNNLEEETFGDGTIVKCKNCKRLLGKDENQPSNLVQSCESLQSDDIAFQEVNLLSYHDDIRAPLQTWASQNCLLKSSRLSHDQKFCRCSLSSPDLMEDPFKDNVSICRRCKKSKKRDNFMYSTFYLPTPEVNHTDSAAKTKEKSLQPPSFQTSTFYRPTPRQNQRDNVANIQQCKAAKTLTVKPKPTSWEKISIEILVVGDHIKWKEGNLDVVHREAIVVNVDTVNSFVHIIWNKPKPLPRAKVEEIIINCKKQKVTFQKAIYSTPSFPADVVVVRAKSRIGENKYHPISNNTRQFPIWCKTNNGSKVPEVSVPIQKSQQLSSRKIQTFSEFNKGDHIKFTRGPIYDHHAIIYNVEPRSKEVTIAHYSTREWPPGILQKASKIFGKGKLAEILLEKLKWDDASRCLVPYTKSEYVQTCETDLDSVAYLKQSTTFSCQNPDNSKWANMVSCFTQTTESYKCMLPKAKYQSPTDQAFEEYMKRSKLFSDGEPKKHRKKSPLRHEVDSVHKVMYSGPIYPKEEILENVKKRLGETSYNLVKNNCEHFAQWCCTRSGKSTQVMNFLKRHAVAIGSVSLVTSVELLQLLLSQIPDSVSHVAMSTADTFFYYLEAVLPIPLLGPVFQCIIMIIIKGIKIYKINERFRLGEITRRDRNRSIGAEIVEGVVSSGLVLLLGFVLGSVIPVPVLGNVLGAILGALIGHGIGKLVKYYLFKKGSTYHFS